MGDLATSLSLFEQVVRIKLPLGRASRKHSAIHQERVLLVGPFVSGSRFDKETMCSPSWNQGHQGTI